MIGGSADAFRDASGSSDCASKKRVQTIPPLVNNEWLPILRAEHDVYMKAEMR
jgi:hypothetical protein